MKKAKSAMSGVFAKKSEKKDAKEDKKDDEDDEDEKLDPDSNPWSAFLFPGVFVFACCCTSPNQTTPPTYVYITVFAQQEQLCGGFGKGCAVCGITSLDFQAFEVPRGRGFGIGCLRSSPKQSRQLLCGEF